jgi:dolichyl-phosphate-mannose-protein mannosyltransferase
MNKPERTEPSAWSTRDTVLSLSVAIAGGLVRFVRVADPSRLIFDEVYYARDACRYVHASAALCGAGTEQTAVHPPLGKWLIATGIGGAGYNSLGWRLAAVLAGTLSIALLYVLARRLIGSTGAATFAAALLAFDFLHFVQSRVAMLDIFAALFGLAAFTSLALDRDAILQRKGEPGTEAGTDSPSRRQRGGSGSRLRTRRQEGVDPPSRPPRRPEPHRRSGTRPWRAAAGIASGAAMASKWSGALVVFAILTLTITWEVAARRRDGRGDAVRRALRDEIGPVLLWLVVAPALVYVASYAGRLDGSWTALPWTEGAWPRVFVERQIHMADFHFDLDDTHSYQSPAWSWVLLKRPVAYYFATTPNGDYREIFAAGNPLVWWASLVAMCYVAIAWVARRDPADGAGFILGGFLLTYGPWFVLLSERSAAFLFYLLPSVPFMCLALAYSLAGISSAILRRTAAGAFMALTMALFAFYYPLLAAVPIPVEEWEDRLWVFDQCTKPRGVPVTSTSTTTVKGTAREVTEVTNSSDDLPPTGWCWR